MRARSTAPNGSGPEAGVALPLAELQRRLSRLIAAPTAADESVRRDREAEARALGIVGDERLDAAGRAGIYAGMWFARIHDAVAEDYPATRRALGAEAFARMLRGYLAAHPPHDPSLRHAGDRLAAYLAGRCEDGLPAWLAEMASLEHAITLAFDARDEDTLAEETLASLAPERWPSLEMRFVSSLVVLRPLHPVDVLRERLLADEPLDDLPPPPAALLTWRQEERVFHRRADGFEASLLDEARGAGGMSFEALCETAASRVEAVGPGSAGRGTPDDAAAAVLGRLKVWLRDGLLADPGLPR